MKSLSSLVHRGCIGVLSCMSETNVNTELYTEEARASLKKVVEELSLPDPETEEDALASIEANEIKKDQGEAHE